eukprot:CAMPEP_0113423262 /NCGR_PEP_ID=MMETSP0013_2-20120614/28921_1 /TAXON_ID=2843 ORGANISM="Skeletonema costatum, Strain 1716" /NCGR_SAMPLE_ID=MMETSP0013_2 /ASSEMBLY_ACC=CAM_ASM_000158 /LENGTH=130 /DNA_ID=CAMNT_0000311103 /DNA_START=332 /DNA_END=720 /DNA_ORIENTATION=+ /assembly_acc=CAM_ASM_000158
MSREEGAIQRRHHPCCWGGAYNIMRSMCLSLLLLLSFFPGAKSSLHHPNQCFVTQNYYSACKSKRSNQILSSPPTYSPSSGRVAKISLEQKESITMLWGVTKPPNTNNQDDNDNNISASNNNNNQQLIPT